MHIQRYSRFVINSVLLAVLVTAARPGFARDKYETIDAEAFGTGSQLGQNIGVTLNIYEFSTPADKQVLVQAYQQAQNKGLVNALQKMKAVGHIGITGTLGYRLLFHQGDANGHRSQDHLCHQSPDSHGGGMARQQFYVLRPDCGVS